MSLYEVLKASKAQRFPDYWTLLWGRKLSESMIKTLTGTLPLTFTAKGGTAVDWTIYGNADGVGERTAQLFDINNVLENYYLNNGVPTQINVGGYVTSDYIPISSNTATMSAKITKESRYGAHCALYDESKTYIRGAGGFVAQGEGIIKFSMDASSAAFLRVDYSTESFTDFMFNTGSTALPYEPYGYKIPLIVSQRSQTDKNYEIFIGDSPLLSRDFVDYESGKIYKAKRIHEDTVTIDGIVWDILDYDHDEVYKADGTLATHTVTIQTHDIINALQYSARQAAFAFPNGLAAGTYHFTVGAQPWLAGDVNKVLTFTLSNAIPTGGQLVFNGEYNQTLVGTTISMFASPASTTAAETATMTEGNTGTDLGTILSSKTDTVNSIDRALLGSNNWLESALMQYLNSDKAAGNVWTPQTVFDRPPSWAGTASGFLNGKSTNFVSHIGTAKKATGRNTISDGGGTAVHDEKFFLLSRSEAYMGDEYTGGECTPYAYYEDYSDHQSPSMAADSNRIKYRAGTASNWWLRTPNISSACSVKIVYTSGASIGSSAANVIGVAPACCIVLDDMDDWVKQTFYTEVDADLPAIELFKGENTLDTTLYNKPKVEIKYK